MKAQAAHWIAQPNPFGDRLVSDAPELIQFAADLLIVGVA